MVKGRGREEREGNMKTSFLYFPSIVNVTTTAQHHHTTYCRKVESRAGKSKETKENKTRGAK